MNKIDFGINTSEFELIKSSKSVILENINSDPAKLALKGVSSTLCTQIRYLQKCKTKIPDYYKVGAIIPPLSYEQCSSELSVSTRGYSGKNCLDLTCGLGVDSYNFSKSYISVVSIERDELLYNITKHNFELLKCNNIELLNCDSSDYINSYDGEKFDIVFIDPARRNNAEKVFSFKQSSPNIIELMPQLEKIAHRIVIKSSPMFDNNEAFELFGNCVTLKTVSICGECKELIIDIEKSNIKSDIVSVVNSSGEITDYLFSKFPNSNKTGKLIDPRYVLLPDAGFAKCRRVADLFDKLLHSDNYYCNGALAISTERTDTKGIRCLEIEHIYEYKPKSITKILKEKGINSATIIIKNFSYELLAIKKALKLKDGVSVTIVATSFSDRNWLLFIK